MRSRSLSFLQFAAMAVAVASLAACSSSNAPPQKPLVLVQVQSVALSDVAKSLQITGAVQSRAETPVAFLTAGQLTQLDAKIGDAVTKGQVLARLSSQEQEADVEAAAAGLQAAEVRLKQAQATLDRQKSLFDQGLTTKSAFDGAQTALETARNSRDSAQAQLDLAQESAGYTELKAPADGVVIRRLYEIDEVVQAGSPVYVIAENGPRKAVLNVQETAIARWDRARSVEVSLVSNPAITTIGTVTEVAPSLDATGTVQVKVTLEDGSKMPLGSAVTAVLSWPAETRIDLPASALWDVAGQAQVWVVDAQDVVTLKPVEIESYGTDDVVISSGLEPGDRVVVSGTQFLSPQQQVEVQDLGA